MSEEKNLTDELRDKLCFKTQHVAKTDAAADMDAAFGYADGYKAFLDASKTEREAVAAAIRLAEENGFRPFCPTAPLKAGDKVYLNNRGRAILLAVIGTRPISDGVSIAAAHVDAPRLDLKPCPVYEDNDLAYLDTHYYGGIKKYQWTAIPLALHGTVVRKDGVTVDVCIGEDDNDPVFCITDLLPHLAGEQMKRSAPEVVKGEDLNLLIGSLPLKDGEGSDLVKLNILNILYEKYGIIEADFLSAELEIVPAFKAKDVGLDRSLVGAYGHDDRVCAYPALTALFETKAPAYTAIAALMDKEEIGSEGVAGMQSAFLHDFIEALAVAQNVPVSVVNAASLCMSADVNAAFDPIYPNVMAKNNSSHLNRGVCVTKYTGSRGKSGTNDATAECMGLVRKLLDDNGVIWQIGELGRVDQGGGGTMAKYVARLNIDTVDIGVPVLSMHAPFEIIAKTDLYMTHKAFAALYNR